MKEKLLQRVDELLRTRQDRELKQILQHQDFHIIAQVIDALHHGKRKTFAVLPPELQAQVALVLSDVSKEGVFPRLSDDALARFLHFNDEDDATDILQHISLPRREVVLGKMNTDKRRKIEKLLRFGSETAGGLMDLNFVIVSERATQREAMEVLRNHASQSKQIPTLLVADVSGRVTDFIPHRQLMFLPPDGRIEDRVHPLITVSHTLDREKVVQTVSRMRCDLLGVIDEQRNVLGVIHLKDLLKVAQAEATEDVYAFAGVDSEEHAYDAVSSKVQRRSRWLILNLFAAFMSSFVIIHFQETIAQLTLLAVYMPLVAGQGGNAGMQSFAVVVRGLALGEVHWARSKKIIIKECATGLCNGLIIGILAAVVVVLLGAPKFLGVILGLAMVINLCLAGFMGALTPFVLKRFGMDPALSGTFVTTATDICGFFVFLSLGTLILLQNKFPFLM